MRLREARRNRANLSKTVFAGGQPLQRERRAAVSIMLAGARQRGAGITRRCEQHQPFAGDRRTRSGTPVPADRRRDHPDTPRSSWRTVRNPGRGVPARCRQRRGRLRLDFGLRALVQRPATARANPSATCFPNAIRYTRVSAKGQAAAGIGLSIDNQTLVDADGEIFQESAAASHSVVTRLQSLWGIT